jgi:hypothetical protein
MLLLVMCCVMLLLGVLHGRWLLRGCFLRLPLLLLLLLLQHLLLCSCAAASDKAEWGQQA